jgi:glycerophosphoryl diester phosphodiesterase
VNGDELRFVVHDACLDLLSRDPDATGRFGAVEVDVARTADGGLVVLPPATFLDKQTSLGIVAATETRRLDPSTFPPVSEVLDRLSELRLHIVLDLKAALGEEKTFAAAIQRLPSRSSVLLISFNHRVVRLVADHWAEGACGIILAGLPVDIHQLAESAKASWVVMQSRFLNESVCQDLRNRNVRTMTFSAPTEDRLHEALSSGADSIMVEYGITRSMPAARRFR